MDAQGLWFDFIIAILATWRVSALLVHEDGPYRLAARLRAAVADAELGRTFDCIACTSLLAALPAALYATPGPRALVPLWLAISGAAILLDRFSGEALVVERQTQLREGDPRDDMLRTTTNAVTGCSGSPSRAEPAP
jgi:hypothetical protein